MVFTREGIIHEKANPALYSSNGVQAVDSVSLTRDRLRRDKEGKLTTPSNSWVCRIKNEYHLLPRGKKTADVSVANSFKMTNTQVLKVGDPLVLLEPHTTLNVTGLAVGGIATLTVEGVKDSYTVVAGTLTINAQVAKFINDSPRLGAKVSAIAAPNNPNFVHLFAKGMKPYLVSATGMVAADTALVPARPVGTIASLQTEGNDYNMVTIVPSTEVGAIASVDIPLGATIDAPVYNEIVGLFNDSLCFEQMTQYLVAPINGAVGMNVFALAHFDESLRQMFPKITFVDNRSD
jgi:hypothetical protein